MESPTTNFQKWLEDGRQRFESARQQLIELQKEEAKLDEQINTFSELLEKFETFPSILQKVQSQMALNGKEIKEKSELSVNAQLPVHTSRNESEELQHQYKILERLKDQRKQKEKLVIDQKFRKPIDKSQYRLS